MASVGVIDFVGAPACQRQRFERHFGIPGFEALDCLSSSKEGEVPVGHSILRSGGRWGLALGLGVVLVFSACGGGGDAEGDGAKANGAEADEATEKKAGTPVDIVNFLYEPAELQVSPGTTVTWTNKDDAPHNVHDISDLGTPISKDMNKGETFSITYEKPGEYKYDCGLHTYMVGTIKVM